MTLEDRVIPYKIDAAALRKWMEVMPPKEPLIPQIEKNFSTYGFGLDPSVIKEIAASPAGYTFVGEKHPDETFEGVVNALINTGKYSVLFLEALYEGNYGEKGDALKDRDAVYGWNPSKYDRIIRHAMERGVEVHGIDSPGRKKAGTNEDIAKWADHILAASRGKCLVLAGAAHVNYWQTSIEHSSLPAQIAKKGIQPQDIVTISFHSINKEDALQLKHIYRFSELPDNFSYFKEERIADYVFLRTKTQVEEALEKMRMYRKDILPLNPVGRNNGIEELFSGMDKNKRISGGQHDA